MSRLNALLLVLKSCEGDMCRNPWQAFADDSGSDRMHRFNTLELALNPVLDSYFDKLPKVQFQECLQSQVVDNERPFFPEAAAEGLGTAWRVTFDDWDSPAFKPDERVPNNTVPAGSVEQRTALYSELMADMRELVEAELKG